MNGVHDMGGMHGMGPIETEPNEPVFHAPWEARTLALTRAIGAWRKWPIDAARHHIEKIPAEAYLRMSYYEKWLLRLGQLLVLHGLASQAEIESGQPDPNAAKHSPPLTADRVATLALNSTIVPTEDAAIAPRFRIGQSVLANNINPIGHTRLPRYARGKAGVIDRDHGVHIFADTNAHGLGENRQHVYSVKFTARELWGPDAPGNDHVYIDLWDDHLESA